jgi:hypothetical protein
MVLRSQWNWISIFAAARYSVPIHASVSCINTCSPLNVKLYDKEKKVLFSSLDPVYVLCVALATDTRTQKAVVREVKVRSM